MPAITGSWARRRNVPCGERAREGCTLGWPMRSTAGRSEAKARVRPRSAQQSDSTCAAQQACRPHGGGEVAEVAQRRSEDRMAGGQQPRKHTGNASPGSLTSPHLAGAGTIHLAPSQKHVFPATCSSVAAVCPSAHLAGANLVHLVLPRLCLHHAATQAQRSAAASQCRRSADHGQQWHWGGFEPEDAACVPSPRNSSPHPERCIVGSASLMMCSPARTHVDSKEHE